MIRAIHILKFTVDTDSDDSVVILDSPVSQDWHIPQFQSLSETLFTHVSEEDEATVQSDLSEIPPSPPAARSERVQKSSIVQEITLDTPETTGVHGEEETADSDVSEIPPSPPVVRSKRVPSPSKIDDADIITIDSSDSENSGKSIHETYGFWAMGLFSLSRKS